VSGRNDWETPRALIEACEREWGKFDADVCASMNNTKAPHYFHIECDGLKQEWFNGLNKRRFWMNPPYTVGKRSVIGDWVQKAIEEAEKGAVVIALLINDPSTKWFDLVRTHAAECWFLAGPRIRFEIDGKPNGSPTQTHVIAAFRKLKHGEKRKGGFWDWRKGARSDREAA